MVTIILEGDDPGVVALLEGHLLAFFDESVRMQDPVEYVRVTVEGRSGKINVNEAVRITSVQTAGVLYRSDDYISEETPYNALWRALKTLLPPRLYDMLKRDFKLKNAAYSKAKYKESKRLMIKQERMEF